MAKLCVKIVINTPIVMEKINIKALSVNSAWQGKRYKTYKYERYINSMLMLLPRINIPQSPFHIDIEFGFSSKLSDIDNGLKPFLDCLVKKYGFDDREIYSLSVKKTIVKKGSEFINFKIKSI
jgi:Holliday junction resolvase RusA-like endonuclease